MFYTEFCPVPHDLKLNIKQERFCREIMIDGNGTQAAIRAGYSKKTAKEMACENLTKPHIQRFIEILKDFQRRKAALTSDLIVQELRDLAEYNIQDFISEKNTIKDVTTINRGNAKAIVGIKTRERFLPDGSREVTTELKLPDKRAAWVDLGRHVGIFEKDNKQKSGPAPQLSDDKFEQLKQIAREAASNTGK